MCRWPGSVSIQSYSHSWMLPREPILIGGSRSRAARTSDLKPASVPSSWAARAQASNRSRRIWLSMVGPAQTLTPEWWASSGEFDGLVTR
jgi:hypothetical protein